MPELPEVETIRADLDKVLRGQNIKRVQVGLPKIVGGAAKAFTTYLKGQKFGPVRRRGKLLLFTLQGSDKTILLHLKMTGQLIYQSRRGVIAGGHSWPPLRPSTSSALRGAGAAELPGKHTHIIFELGENNFLFFNDLRQFGYAKLADTKLRDAALAKFGVEPLGDEFTVDYLASVLRGRKTTLKQVLLDQTKIAGLGNIYVDEAAHYAGIKLTRRAGRLSQAEIKKLHRGIRHVLTQSLKHRGTTFNSFTDAAGRAGNYVSKLKVYGRAGKPCLRPACRQAGVIIKKAKVAGRGTHWCPTCQA
ncbi:bifunctional DNA-formamidopyrimidine glycosylase/DNA-(apurinic or apyrimidinic site) lyase [bacterium]|nr:bifunctional DNA-formamidopyrimidine glycosylase/DNA-(apurinic or apyrimidinic site) lyase [bacterium]